MGRVKQLKIVHWYSVCSYVIQQGLGTTNAEWRRKTESICAYRDGVVVEKLWAIVECPVFRKEVNGERRWIGLVLV